MHPYYQPPQAQQSEAERNMDMMKQLDEQDMTSLQMMHLMQQLAQQQETGPIDVASHQAELQKHLGQNRIIQQEADNWPEQQKMENFGRTASGIASLGNALPFAKDNPIIQQLLQQHLGLDPAMFRPKSNPELEQLKQAIQQHTQSHPS